MPILPHENSPWTHVDIFSGIGGWPLAAHANGLTTIALCEREEWLAAGLERVWGCPCYRAVESFPSEEYAGRTWLLTGSPPCQSASRAGNQGGESDVRWLWPQAVSVCSIIRPAWFCFENVVGLLDVGLDGILAELEGLGYEVQPVSIPACAIDSPQDRERIWIIGHRNGELGNVPKPGLERPDAACLVRERLASQPTQGEFVGHGGQSVGRQSEQIRPGRNADAGATQRGPGESDRWDAGGTYSEPESQPVADGQREHSGRSVQTGRPQGPLNRADRLFALGHWGDFQWLLCPDGKGGSVVRRAPVGLHSLAARVQSGIPKRFRSKMIAALGNSIVWPVA